MKIALLGGTRGTGKLVLEQALEKGHEVRLLARNVDGLPKHDRLRVVKGDARKADDIAAVVEGADAVVTSIGTADLKKTDHLVSEAARATVEAMKRHGVKRVVLMSVLGAGEMPFFIKPWLGLFRLLAPAMFDNVVEEKNRAEGIFAAAELDYTFVRAPRMTDGAKSGRVTAKVNPFPSFFRLVSRADLAAFTLEELERNAFVRAAPVVWS